MPNPELILALIAALGGGAALPELIRGGVGEVCGLDVGSSLD